MLKFKGLRHVQHQGRRIATAVFEENGKERLMSAGVVAAQIRELLVGLQTLQEMSKAPVSESEPTPSNSEETSDNRSPD